MSESELRLLLREASDPATPGDTLRTMVDLAILHRPWHEGAAGALVPRITAALARNPSLPLPMLRALVLHRRAEDSFEAWHNPSLPLLMLSEPDGDYADAALRVLRWLEQNHVHQPVEATLADRIASWATWPAQADPAQERARTFAHHVAVLFVLPWSARG